MKLKDKSVQITYAKSLLPLIIGAICVWIASEGMIAVWIFSSPKEPEPMGYAGTFYAFSLALSVAHWTVVGFICAILALRLFWGRRHRSRERARGFDVIHPDDIDVI